jgi:hypothetical protein
VKGQASAIFRRRVHKSFPLRFGEAVAAPKRVAHNRRAQHNKHNPEKPDLFE